MPGIRRREMLAGLAVLRCGRAAAHDDAGPLLVPLARIGEGEQLRIAWRGQPVFVRHRSAAEIAAVRAVPLSTLRDPERDEDRTRDPNWLVVIGRCTHEGCEPFAGLGDDGGWLCLCHGSQFDLSGRVRKGPAPTNLPVPPHHFPAPSILAIGGGEA